MLQDPKKMHVSFGKNATMVAGQCFCISFFLLSCFWYLNEMMDLNGRQYIEYRHSVWWCLSRTQYISSILDTYETPGRYYYNLINVTRLGPWNIYMQTQCLEDPVDLLWRSWHAMEAYKSNLWLKPGLAMHGKAK